MTQDTNTELHSYMLDMNIAAYIHPTPKNNDQVRIMAKRFRKSARTVLARSVLKRIVYSTLPSDLIKTCYEEYTKIN